MQEYIPVILAGLLTACAPARPEDAREVAMREVRVAQIAAASGYQQQKKDTSHPPKVQFTPPPPPKSAAEVERDKLDGKPVVRFTPPVVRKDVQQKKSPIKKVKVDEATGEVKVYDANNKDITGQISPRTKKVTFVKDASGGGKVLDENGKEVKDIPPPPPPVQFKKPAAQPAPGKKVSGIADPNNEHNREIPPPPPPVPPKKDNSVKKVKLVNEATGEVKLYDANGKDITGNISPKTKKARLVKDAAGKLKVIDENGKEVKDVPPPPPDLPVKVPAEKEKDATGGTSASRMDHRLDTLVVIAYKPIHCGSIAKIEVAANPAALRHIPTIPLSL